MIGPKIVLTLKNSDFSTLKTCSCPFVRYFRTLFWDDITKIWDENIVYLTFLTEKKHVLDQYDVCLLNFHQQIMVISSQNKVRKYRTKVHEQVYYISYKRYLLTCYCMYLHPNYFF